MTSTKTATATAAATARMPPQPSDWETCRLEYQQKAMCLAAWTLSICSKGSIASTMKTKHDPTSALPDPTATDPDMRIRPEINNNNDNDTAVYSTPAWAVLQSMVVESATRNPSAIITNNVTTITRPMAVVTGTATLRQQSSESASVSGRSTGGCCRLCSSPLELIMTIPGSTNVITNANSMPTTSSHLTGMANSNDDDGCKDNADGLIGDGHQQQQQRQLQQEFVVPTRVRLRRIPTCKSRSQRRRAIRRRRRQHQQQQRQSSPSPSPSPSLAGITDPSNAGKSKNQMLITCYICAESNAIPTGRPHHPRGSKMPTTKVAESTVSRGMKASPLHNKSHTAKVTGNRLTAATNHKKTSMVGGRSFFSPHRAWALQQSQSLNNGCSNNKVRVNQQQQQQQTIKNDRGNDDNEDNDFIPLSLKKTATTSSTATAAIATTAPMRIAAAPLNRKRKKPSPSLSLLLSSSSLRNNNKKKKDNPLKQFLSSLNDP